MREIFGQMCFVIKYKITDIYTGIWQSNGIYMFVIKQKIFIANDLYDLKKFSNWNLEVDDQFKISIQFKKY
ncbi:hypothetical protein BpHYR1_054423 [Brachionus plicatilis]|uniref:Uncharacterized protein n=1 Tax=Brachionus plicatilis TaxID=10195 RepID=A0A3M7SE66_BRAPC|nr:hypothetical protein BpHYR1_054423 [Brachionus plicatilis]